MFSWLKGLLWPTIYEPRPVAIRPSFEEIKAKAREIVDLPPGSDLTAYLGPEWDSLSLKMLFHAVDDYKVKMKKQFVYHREGYAFAHKKYWGT